MRRLSLLVSLLVVFCAVGYAQPLNPSCTGITSLSDCPDTGCGNGDGLLNQKKNRTDDTPDNIQTRTLSQIRAFSQPTSWTRNQSRASIAFREDRGVVVKAYLRDARTSGSETTNCKLGGQDNNDFHLDLVGTKNAAKSTAVTAEITPRLRRSGWDFGKLDFLGEEKYYVRVTGWYTLDTMHIANPIVRATNWEIHPVTKFEVCTLTKFKCDQGQGWVLLEDFEIP